MLEVFVSYKVYSRYLKYLGLALFWYVFTAFAVKIDWGEVLVSTLIPHVEFSKVYLLNMVAILGTTISPYLFFWQAGEEVEEEVAENKLTAMGVGTPKVTNRDIRKLRVDTISGMLFSNFIMFFYYRNDWCDPF